MVSVVKWQFGSWVRILLPFISIFFLLNWRDLHFHKWFAAWNIFEVWYKSRKQFYLDCVKILKGERAFRRMLTSADLSKIPVKLKPPLVVVTVVQFSMVFHLLYATAWRIVWSLSSLFVLCCAEYSKTFKWRDGTTRILWNGVRTTKRKTNDKIKLCKRQNEIMQINEK